MLDARVLLHHTDVKPSNVLINTQGQVKMCDFGISGYLVDSVAKTIDAGCKPYMAVRLNSTQEASYVASIRFMWKMSSIFLHTLIFKSPHHYYVCVSRCAVFSCCSQRGSTQSSIRGDTMSNQTSGV